MPALVRTKPVPGAVVIAASIVLLAAMVWRIGWVNDLSSKPLLTVFMAIVGGFVLLITIGAVILVPGVILILSGMLIYRGVRWLLKPGACGPTRCSRSTARVTPELRETPGHAAKRPEPP